MERDIAVAAGGGRHRQRDQFARLGVEAVGFRAGRAQRADAFHGLRDKGVELRRAR